MIDQFGMNLKSFVLLGGMFGLILGAYLSPFFGVLGLILGVIAGLFMYKQLAPQDFTTSKKVKAESEHKVINVKSIPREIK